MPIEPHVPPTAEKDPAAPPHAELSLEPLPPLADDYMVTSGDAANPRRHPRRRRGGRDNGESRAKSERATQERNPILTRAEVVFKETKAAVYAVVDKRDITRPNEAGDGEEEIDSDEWSYGAFARDVATVDLGFDYTAKLDHPVRRKSAKRRRERPYKKIAENQVASDHANAREQLLLLVNDRYVADLTRLDVVLAAAREQANAEGHGAEVLAVTRFADGGDTLEQWLNKQRLNIEYARFDVMRNAADWFEQRVNQVETLMTTVTRRSNEYADVQTRVGKLNTNAEFQAQLKELEKDIQMFQAFTELPLMPGAERLKARMARLLADAQRKKKNLDDHFADLLKYAERKRFDRDKGERGEWVLDASGKNRVEQAEYNVLERILTGGQVADLLQAEANKVLIGLSPEQELAFWNSMRDLFESVLDEMPRGLKGNERDAFFRRRFIAVNERFNLSRVDATSRRAFLVGVEDTSDSGEKLPDGVGQLLAKCKTEAMMADDVREGLTQVTYKIGIDAKKMVQRLLIGRANSSKIEALARFNALLDNKTAQAAKALGDVLAGKDYKKLRWNRRDEPKDADRPLILQLRGKVFELLQMTGDLKGPDQAVLRDLLFTVPEEAAEVTEAEPANDEPLFDQIKNGTLPDELFEGANDATDSAELYQQRLAGLIERLRKAIPNGIAQEALFGQLSGLVDLNDKAPALADVKTFLARVEDLVTAAEAFQANFGKGWHKRFELVKENKNQQAGEKRNTPNTELVIRIIDYIANDHKATMALLLAGDVQTTAKAVLHEVGKADQVTADNADKICLAVSQLIEAGKLNELTPELADQWLSGEGLPSAEVAADAEPVSENVLVAILNGQISDAVAAEAFPADSSQAAMTAEALKTNLPETIDGIRTASHSPEFTKYLVDHFGLTVTADMSPAEQVRRTVETLVAIETMFQNMEKYFGADWVVAANLAVRETEGSAKLRINEEAVQQCLEYCSKTDVLNAFAFDTDSKAVEELSKQLDSESRAALSALEIQPSDQLYFALQCISTDPKASLPEPNIGLRRIAKCMDFAKRSRKKGDELLGYLHLKEGGNYNDAEILSVMTNEDWDK